MKNTTAYALVNADQVFVGTEKMVSYFSDSPDAVEQSAMAELGLDSDEPEAILVIETLNEYGDEVFHRFIAQAPIVYGEDTDDTARAYDFLLRKEVILTAQNFKPVALG